ncbi:MAG: hypothetical protein VB071_09840 [Lawsonibacter sp.]|nr:hypothetical protein [Lawsonibacter sp.]
MGARVKHLILATIPYAAVLCVFYLLHYIDVIVIVQIYLPIYCIAVAAIRGKKNWIGHVVLISAELGLISEYVIHVMRPDRPTMAGAFLNASVVIIGLIAGILLQIRMGNRK